MTNKSVPAPPATRELRARVLKEAVDRFNKEMMDHEERLMLQDRIRRLRKSLAS